MNAVKTTIWSTPTIRHRQPSIRRTTPPWSFEVAVLASEYSWSKDRLSKWQSRVCVGCSVVFWLGDLNYRISDVEVDTCKEMIEKRQLQQLLQYDQVLTPLFVLRCFSPVDVWKVICFPVALKNHFLPIVVEVGVSLWLDGSSVWRTGLDQEVAALTLTRRVQFWASHSRTYAAVTKQMMMLLRSTLTLWQLAAKAISCFFIFAVLVMSCSRRYPYCTLF